MSLILSWLSQELCCSNRKLSHIPGNMKDVSLLCVSIDVCDFYIGIEGLKLNIKCSNL